MDNIRNVIGCAVAGLTKANCSTRRRSCASSPRCSWATRLSRTFREVQRRHQRLHRALHARRVAGSRADAGGQGHRRPQVQGFNVAIGGKMGSGGCRLASPLDLFVEPRTRRRCAARSCSSSGITDRAGRATGSGCRSCSKSGDRNASGRRSNGGWTVRSSAPAAMRRIPRSTDHIGVHGQKQPGLNYVGLLVAVGRVSAAQLREVARVSSAYGTGCALHDHSEHRHSQCP
jgi:ferredoxin-nitrite reductase